MTDPAEAKTDRVASGVMIRFGRHALTLPVATVLAAMLAALGGAWSVVASDRAKGIARIEALEERVDIQNIKLEITYSVLVDIRAQIARVDARVAEVQVTLMRRDR